MCLFAANIKLRNGERHSSFPVSVQWRANGAGSRGREIISSSGKDNSCVTRIPFEMAVIPPSIRTLVGRIHIAFKTEKSSDLLAQTPVFLQYGPEVEEPGPQVGHRQGCAIVLTAIEMEYKAARKHLDQPIKEVRYKKRIYEKGKFQPNGRLWNVVIREMGRSNVNAALETGAAIRRFKPQVILLLGKAGGKETKSVRKGDVVVATKVYNAISGKVSPSESGDDDAEFRFRPDAEESDQFLVNLAKLCRTRDSWRDRIKEEIPSNNPRIHIDPVASTDMVYTETSSDFYKMTLDRYDDALAAEMEGFGFLAAAHEEHTLAVVIRGISDLMEGKPNSDAEGWPEIAMINASAFAFELIANIDYSEG